MGAFTGINMVRQHAGEKSVLVDWASVQTQLEMLLTQGAETPMDVVQHPELPPWFDWTKFRRGQQYFHKNIFAMFVAKMSGLLTILAIPSILRVLMMTKQSFDPLTAFHRYVQTTAIMLTWYNGDLLEPTSRAHKSLMGVRGRHCSASRRAKKAGQGSISQLDMVLTQFGFMGFAVVVPQKLGMAGNLEDVEGFIHFWRVVGYLLGIEDRFNLCRESVLETRLLCEGLVEKVFAPALRKPSDDFRSMSRALVEGMWNMTPFLNYTAFLGFIAHLAGIDDADNNNYYKTKRKTFGTDPAMECSLGCTWCQEILLILISFFMIVGGVLVLIVFGDLLTYHRVLLPVALVITCGVVGTIACYVVHYQRFVEAEQSRWLLVLTGAFFVCCGLGCYVCLAYYVHKDIHLGKMDAYTVDVHNKEMIDKTQMLLECCGEHSYTDWFNVDWQGTDIEPVGECSEDDNIMSRASVPFSCCSPDAAAPCIHDYLQMDQDSRLYRRGCKPALVAVASLFALIFGLLLLIMGVLMLLWAFFGTDEECDDDCECEYEDKISILMPPSSFAESQSATEEGKSTVSVYNAAPEVVKPPAGATLGDDKYQTPEERSAQVLADHERVLRQISPSSYRKSTTVSSSTAVESIYSDTESEESFASEYSSA